MQIAAIIAHLEATISEFGCDGLRDTRGMSCLGASDEDIAREHGRADGRQEVVDDLRSLLAAIRASQVA